MDTHKFPDAPEASLHSLLNAAEAPANCDEQLPPIVSPPYWQHARSASRNSVFSIGKPQPINLEDNTDEPEGTRSPLWAKVISIDSYTIVTGNVKGVGDYVVWICRVQTLDGGSVTIRKRCRMLVLPYRLHSFGADSPSSRLYAASWPLLTQKLPCLFLSFLPKASSVRLRQCRFYKSGFNHPADRFRPAFLEKRRAGLEYFLKYG